ncbi:MAG: CzcE family metal-binding protein [Massilia sp.]
MIKNTSKTAAAVLFTTLLAASAFAGATGLTNTAADYGQAANAGAADRTVALRDGARYLNVTDGETVTVELAGQSFTWHVSIFPGRSQFKLAAIAPAELAAAADNVTVYVAPNPTYFGN